MWCFLWHGGDIHKGCGVKLLLLQHGEDVYQPTRSTTSHYFFSARRRHLPGLRHHLVFSPARRKHPPGLGVTLFLLQHCVSSTNAATSHFSGKPCDRTATSCRISPHDLCSARITSSTKPLRYYDLCGVTYCIVSSK